MRPLWVLAGLLIAASVQAAEPYTPASDDAVLARSAVLAGSGPAGLRELRRRLDAAPTDVDAASAYASQAIALGRAQSDPRYFGYAEAALQPWWRSPAPPPGIRYLRALLLQRQHQFAAALADLDALLLSNSRNAEARLARAVIHQVQGRPQPAQADCAALVGVASLFTATTCLSASGSLGGRGAQRYPALVALLDSPAGLEASAEERRWALTVAAELAARLGRDGEAAAWFEQAAALAAQQGVDDVYLESAWADFRLGRGEFAAVAARLAGARADASLLRLAMAERRLAAAGETSAEPRWRQHRDLLSVRFSSARARGETAHGREEALFALHLADDPATALRRARENWQAQREPADARVLLEAARAAGDDAAAEPVRDWLRATGLEDQALRVLAGLPAGANP